MWEICQASLHPNAPPLMVFCDLFLSNSTTMVQSSFFYSLSIDWLTRTWTFLNSHHLESTALNLPSLLPYTHLWLHLVYVQTPIIKPSCQLCLLASLLQCTPGDLLIPRDMLAPSTHSLLLPKLKTPALSLHKSLLMVSPFLVCSA